MACKPKPIKEQMKKMIKKAAYCISYELSQIGDLIDHIDSRINNLPHPLLEAGDGERRNHFIMTDEDKEKLLNTLQSLNDHKESVSDWIEALKEL